MVQTLSPDATIAAGSWSPSAFGNLTADDGSVCRSETQNNAPSTTLEVGLSNGTDPGVNTGHVIRVRWFCDGGGGANADPICDLVEGSTVRASLVGANITTTEVEATYTLTGTEADSITDYTNLRLRLRASNLRRNLNVDLAQFEIPDAAGGSPQTIGVTAATEVEAVSIVAPLATWQRYFVPPKAVTGFTAGDHTALDEWPFSGADNATVAATSGQSRTVSFTFDLSGSPGDKKGFRLWYNCYGTEAEGFSLDEVRLKNGGTTLWTNSAPGVTFQGNILRVMDIPNSAFSGDPPLNNLIVEFDVTNLRAGNQNFGSVGMRLSKSPFTAAQEAALPTDLSGQDYAALLAQGLGLIGTRDTEPVVVIPDMSGAGRHLVRWSGTGAVYRTGDGGYIDFPDGSPTRFIGAWGTRITGNHIWHVRHLQYTYGITQAIIATAHEFAGVVSPPTDPNDKPVFGIDSSSGIRRVYMFGDGSGPAHVYGAATVSADTWYRTTIWVQDSGNEHAWINEDASPDLDAASGSNNLYVFSLGDRETDDRPNEGRVSELWVVADQSIAVTESDIDSARSDPAWGGTGGATIAVGAASETEAAVAVSQVLGGVTVAVTAAAETEAATAVTATPGAATIAVTAAAESEAATSVSTVSGGVTVAVTAASETEAGNTSTPVPGVTSIAITAVTETETAQSVGNLQSQAVVVGAAAESEAAAAIAIIAGATSISVTAASEVEAGAAVTAAGAISVALTAATETESAGAVAITGETTLVVTAATETEQGVAIGVLSPTSVAIGAAAEVEAAGAVAVSLAAVVPVGVAAETEVAEYLDVDWMQVIPIIAAAETETAEPIGITTGATSRAVTSAAETESSEPVGVTSPVSIAVTSAAESEAAEEIIGLETQFVQVTPAEESEIATSVGSSSAGVVSVGVATETEVAEPVPLFVSQNVAVAPATETETALVVVINAEGEIASSLEVETATAVGVTTTITLQVTGVAESEAADPVSAAAVNVIAIGVASEVEQGELVAGGATQAIAVDPAQETEEAAGVAGGTGVAVISVTPAAETEQVVSAGVVAGAVVRAVGVVIENEVSDPAVVAAIMVLAVEEAFETEAASGIGALFSLFVPVGIATEIEAAVVIAFGGALFGHVTTSVSTAGVSSVVEEAGLSVEVTSSGVQSTV